MSARMGYIYIGLSLLFGEQFTMNLRHQSER
jgi:hypothetical protein